jgi:bacteriocin-like protein
MKTINIEEMEKIEGGISLAAFGCGLGLVGIAAGQVYLGVTTLALCSVALSE